MHKNEQGIRRRSNQFTSKIQNIYHEAYRCYVHQWFMHSFHFIGYKYICSKDNVFMKLRTPYSRSFFLLCSFHVRCSINERILNL